MNERNFLTIAAPVLGALLFFHCGDKAGGEHPGNDAMAEHGGSHSAHHMQNQTRVVKNDGVQTAFDLSTAEAHAKMARQMKLDWQAPAGSDHHLSITLMDLDTKQVIREGKVKISLTGPDGRTITREGQVLAGGGMHHHGLDFKMSGPGTYTVQAEFEYEGKTYAPQAEFQM